MQMAKLCSSEPALFIPKTQLFSENVTKSFFQKGGASHLSSTSQKRTCLQTRMINVSQLCSLSLSFLKKLLFQPGSDIYCLGSLITWQQHLIRGQEETWRNKNKFHQVQKWWVFTIPLKKQPQVKNNCKKKVIVHNRSQISLKSACVSSKNKPKCFRNNPSYI